MQGPDRRAPGCDSSRHLHAQWVSRREQQIAARRAAVEQQVDEREVRHEAELAVALRILRVIEVLPDHADAGAAHPLDVEVVRRATAAGEIRARADLAA